MLAKGGGSAELELEQDYLPWASVARRWCE